MRASSSYTLQLALTLSTILIATRTGLTEGYNARLSGELSKVKEIVGRANSDGCVSSRCLLGDRSIKITVATPMVGSVSVTLTRAAIPTHVIREHDSSTSTASLPILLKGVGRIRHYNNDGSTALIPVAATIFRDDGEPTIEISLPHSFRFSQSSGIGVYRSQLGALTNDRKKNARGEVPSSSAFRQETCGLSMGSSRSQATRRERIEPIVRSLSTYNVIYVGTDFDSSFIRKAGCSSTSACNNKILSIMNQASVFYERQLGYSLEVTRQFGPTNFGSETISSFLLDSVAESNRANRGQFIHNGSNTGDNQIDLFKSFTGRTMNDKVIGIAYVGTLCQNAESTFSNAITQYVSAAVNPVVAAHEIGHTLNAQHVSSGIMQGKVSTSPPQSFASESLLTISNYLNQNYGECRQGISSGMNNTASNDSHAGKPVTMQISARATGIRRVLLSAQISTLQTGCQIRIRAASSSREARIGKIVMSILPSTTVSSASASISYGTIASASGNRRVYLVGEYNCPVGSITEVSKIISFDPNTIRGVRARTTTTKWISLLRSILS